MPVRFSDNLNQPVVLTDVVARFFGSDVGEVYDLLVGALALLRDNADIAKWVVCLVDDWSALVPPRWVPQPALEFGGLYNTGLIKSCFDDAIRGDFAIYLIDQYNVNSSGRCPGSTGSATEPDKLDDFGRRVLDEGWPLGLLIPVNGRGGRSWQCAAQMYKRGGPEALCALLAMAEVLIHEFLHICVVGELEAQFCWQLQHMAANTFQWAMGERFPCLQNLPECPRVSPTYVMNAGPAIDGIPPPLACSPNPPILVSSPC